ncbi:MAG: DUF6538 domain-containing protein, partial [Paracoccaceae bacterium]
MPADLVSAFKRKEFTKSLETTDYAEAKKLGRIVVAGWEQDFADARDQRHLSEDEMRFAVMEHYQAQLSRDDFTRQNLPRVDEIEAARQNLIARAKRHELEVEQPLAMLDASLDYS